MDSTAQRFFERNYKPDDRLAIVMIDRKPNEKQTVRQLITKSRHLESLLPYLQNMNQQGHDVYVALNPLHEKARGRTKDDIGQVRHVFMDFDVDAKARIGEMIKSGRVPRPNEIVHTSPGKSQALWRVEGFSKEQAESLSRGLVREFGADPAATDVNRVMRVPGLHNRKYEPAVYVGVQRVHNAVSRPDQFPVYEQDRQIGTVRGYERDPRQQGGISQSERDWAYVRDALKRGVDASELRVKLAEMRPDKANPGYYARHTIANAERRLQIERGR